MSEKFDIEFRAKVDQFQKDVQAVASTIAQIGSDAERTGGSVDDFAGRLNKAAADAGKLSVKLKDLNSGTARQTGAVQQTSAAWDKQDRIYNDYLTSQAKGVQTQKDSTQGIIAARYALYDVAAAYGAVSAVLLASSGYAIKVGADFESAFANVRRTSDDTSGKIDGFKQQLIDLSTTIPKSFEDLAGIATLGNQLGVGEKDLKSFTTTVAQFSAVTGISADQTALTFGQLGNILGVTADKYSNLGSSIALVGRKSAATEQQIISTATELGTSARAAGFSADAVIGLAGALASIHVPPERSRSTILQFFEKLNGAAASGGQQFQDFATVVGLSVDELKNKINTGQGEDILKRFVGSLNGKDTVGITKALDDLGLASLRVTPTMRALADNQQLLNQTFADGKQGFIDNTELARQYAIIVGTLSSQWQIFINALNTAIEAMSQGSVAGLAGLLGVLTDIVVSFTGFINSPIGQFFSKFGLGIATAVGALIAFRVGIILTTASLFALQTAQVRLASSGAIGSLGSLIGAMRNYRTATVEATGATYGFQGALSALAKTTIILAVIGGAVGFLTDFNGSMAITQDVMANVATGLGYTQIGFAALAVVISGTLSTIAAFARGAANVLPFLGGLADGLENVARATAKGAGNLLSTNQFFKSAKDLHKYAQGYRDLADASNKVGDAAAGAASSVGGYGDAIDRIPVSAGKAAKGTKGLTAEIRTLVDYASDLSGVMKRAFDIRFGSSNAMDSVITQWRTLNDTIDENRAKLLSLTADKSVQEYFLGIANAYGDTLRAGTITAGIADLNNQIADATANSSTELTGNSKAAVTNRKRVTDLVTGYQDYIDALASSGASQDTLNAAVNSSRTEFIGQAQALGYSNAQLQPYIASFRDMAKVIRNVPRNITVNIIGLDAASAALAEFAAKARKTVGSGIDMPISSTYNGSGAAKAARAANLQAQISFLQAQINRAAGPSAPRMIDSARVQIAALAARLTSGQYKSGGYTGDGGTSAPAGVVHGKEFVFDAPATKNAGVGNLYAMQRALQAGRGMQSGGYAGRSTAPAATGTMVVALDMAQYKGLVEAGHVTVQLGDQQVANATNNTNKQYANLGRG